MKFSIDKNIIIEGLNNVIKAISSKNIIPVLNGIKFDLEKEGLNLVASDGELTIKVLIPTKEIKKIDNNGSIVIQSKYLLDILRKMPSDIINFEVIEGLKIKIYSDNNQFNLNCLDPSEFPIIKIEESKEPINIDAEIFKTIINQTSFAISNQELRPLLTGINIKINGDLLECVATDSYRLAKKTIKLDNPINSNINIIIPGRSITELEKMISDDKLEIHIFNNKILFKYKNILFQSNLLNGTYPNTNNLIPNDFEYIVKVNNIIFSSSIDRTALLTQGKDKNIIKMHLDSKKMLLTSSSELGKSEEKIDVESNNSEKLEISFSSKYMLEALKTIKEEDLLLLMNGDTKPIVIKSVSDESLIQLILPIKTY